MTKIALEGPQGLPFSKAITQDSKYTMEIAGQVGLNAQGELAQGIEAQTKQSMENVKKILEEVGWSFDNLTKVRIFLTDMNDYAAMNEAYAECLEGALPTRVALAVKALPLGALIELDCTASGDEVKE